MKNEWPEIPLSDVCVEIVDCVNKTAPSVDYPTPYKMIRTTNVKNGKIDLGSVKYVTKDVYEKWVRRSIPQIGDVILTREAPMGEVGMVNTTDRIFLGQRLMQYRANSNVLDSKFLLYSFQGPFLQQQIMQHEGSGSTVSHIRVPDAMKFKIRLAPMAVQRRIADILGSLDEKIDLNRRMNETLEQMAMSLFKHWFINSTSVDTQVTLGELIEINPRCAIKRGSDVPYVDMQALSTNSLSVEDKNIVSRPFTSGSKFEVEDTLLARITPCLENGKTAYVDFLDEGAVGFGSTEFLVLRAKNDVSSEYVYCMSRSSEFRQHAIQSMVGTSGRQRVQPSAIEQFVVDKPDFNLMSRFGEITRDWFQLIRNNVVEIGRMESVRDYLLPRLLSGVIDLSDAIEQVKEVV